MTYTSKWIFSIITIAEEEDSSFNFKTCFEKTRYYRQKQRAQHKAILLATSATTGIRATSRWPLTCRCGCEEAMAATTSWLPCMLEEEWMAHCTIALSLLLLFQLKDLRLEEWVHRAQKKVSKENNQEKNPSLFWQTFMIREFKRWHSGQRCGAPEVLPHGSLSLLKSPAVGTRLVEDKQSKFANLPSCPWG